MRTTTLHVARRIQENIAMEQLLLHNDCFLAEVCAAARSISDSLRKGHKVLLFGNGGSAAGAQHFAAELTGRYMKERPALAAIALTSDTSALTAIANDYGYGLVFSRQLQGVGQKGDVAIGISTSGQSENVTTALESAKTKGLTTILLTAGAGGQAAHTVDYCLRVPPAETCRIQELHLLITHILCELVESELLENRDAS